MKKRLLLATWEGGGVIPPEMGLARRLVARGHSVHVLADPSVEEAARAAGCEFSPWIRAPHKRSLAPDEDFIRDWEFKNLFKLFKQFLDAFLCGPADRFAADTLEVLDRYPADAVIADMSMLGAMMAAEARKLPCAVVVPNVYMRPAPGIPPIGPGFMPARGPLGRLRDGVMRAFSARLWKKGLPAVNRARSGLGLEPIDEFWSQYDRADRVLVLTARAFDFPAVTLPSNVSYVGPFLDEPQWAGKGWSAPWPADNQDPIVLVGLSSTFQDQIPVLSRLAEALAGLPVRALITLGPALAPNAVRATAPNVVCVSTAPHSAIIPQASVVVTHCGHGTTLRALAAGVPLVCMPMGRDQNDNAARVVARGAGLRIKPTAAPATIRRAVERVLSDPSYRQAAARLRDAIAVEIAASDPVAEIEAILPRATELTLAHSTASG